MSDNKLVIDLQTANDSIPADSVRVRIFDSATTLAATLTTTKDTITPGRFFATMTGSAGVYFGHVEVLAGAAFVPTGQQFDTFLWSGTAFLYSATTQDLAAAFTEIKGAGFNPATDTLEAIIDRGNTAWITATGFATLAQVEAAITAAQSAILAGGFTSGDRNILIAAEAAARAVASGRHKIDYAASTATQYNADGSVRTVFDLVDADGNPATTGATAVERVPQ